MPQVDRTQQRNFVLRRWRKLHDQAFRRGGGMAIFGAGQHTRWLLSEVEGEQTRNVVAILDDNDHCGEIRGIPVIRPAAADLSRVKTVVLSSDRYEAALARRCREIFRGRVRTERIYRGRRFVTEDGKSIEWNWRTRLERWCRGIIYAPERRFAWAQRFLRGFFREQRRRFWHDGDAPPHWADHRLDLALWPEHRDASFLERGVYSREVMRPGCTVLDLCCGDGFYAYFFYSRIGARIDAVDIDEEALRSAQEHHAAGNIAYSRLDIVRDAFSQDRYDVVCWDGALGHFAAEDIDLVLSKIARAVGDNGVLTGFEEIESPDTQSWDHKVALTTSDDLRALLGRFFKHVHMLTVDHPRRLAYFRCAQDESRLAGRLTPR